MIDPIHRLQAKSSSKETCKWREQKPGWSQKCCASMGKGQQETFNPNSEINLLSSLGVLKDLINYLMSVKHCKLLIYKFHYCISYLPVQHLLLLYIEPMTSKSQATVCLCAMGQRLHTHTFPAKTAVAKSHSFQQDSASRLAQGTRNTSYQKSSSHLLASRLLP